MVGTGGYRSLFSYTESNPKCINGKVRSPGSVIVTKIRPVNLISTAVKSS